MSKKILVANWKNRPGSLSDASSLLRNLSRSYLKYKKLSVYIAPPAPFLGLVAEKARNFAKLASQGMPLEEKNSLTEGLVPEMVKSLGVKLSIVGHSERRALGETDKIVSEKVRTALRYGITPLVCIGEEEHDAEGEYLDFLRQQLEHSLEGVKRTEADKLMVAYEPVWAIGSKAKKVITPRDLSQTAIYIKRLLSDMYGRENAEKIPILYGGSVDASNALELYKEGNVEGFLVGRASLDYKSFLGIAEALVS